ncbi:hypothetical protein [Haloferula sp. BvORR071]|uniref:hypothetical protein n=1 Tax=Haloferula sp. BvORR071 TaxID=1396141 RepID=UPI0005566BA2|nr:hypothetical protein [Haloferula sp. BvORR071]
MRRSLWIIPPLLGIAAYFAAAAKSGSGDVPPLATPGKSQERREAPTRGDVSAALAEFKQEWEVQQKQRASENATLSAAVLRDKILALKRTYEALPEDTDWDTSEDFQARMAAAAHELGRLQGGDAAAWIEGIDPELRFAVMAGWAESDPDAAFKAVTASERRGPCAITTLMELLQKKAGAGNAALALACSEVSWELFRDLPGDPFGENSLEIAVTADAAPWIESGAARALAEQGVRIDNLFTRWAGTDPSHALVAALDWPRSSDSEILKVLGVGLKDSAKCDEIRRSLEGLPPEQFAQAAAAVSKYCKRNTQLGSNLASSYPMLISADSAEPPP